MKISKILKGVISAVLCTGILLSLSACGGKENNQDSGKLKIVTTVFPSYDFARQVAGDKADIKMLLPVGTETHHYEPTPSDVIAVKNCDIFIYIGGTNEQWAEKLIADTDKEKTKIVRLVDSIENLCPPMTNSGHSHDGEEHKDEHSHNEGDYDQHIWTSPKNAEIMLQTICDAICEKDVANADSYKANSDKYKNEITALHNDFKALADSTEQKLLVFADKFPFTYFAREYGFTCLAAFSSCSDESEPSAATVAMLIDEIKEHKIPALLYLKFGALSVTSNICREAGVSAYSIHTCHNVTKEEFDKGESYVSLMRVNYEHIKIALGK